MDLMEYGREHLEARGWKRMNLVVIYVLIVCYFQANR